MDKIIKQGYMVEVTSWENDGDNYRTVTIEGLALNEGLLVCDLCEAFRSANGKHKGFGNTCVADSEEDVTNLLDDLYKKYQVDPHAEVTDEEALLWDVIGEWADGEYYRVVEAVDMYYNPQEITLMKVTPQEVMGHE